MFLLHTPVAFIAHSDWMTMIIVISGFLIWSVWRNAGGFLEQKSFEVIHDYDRKSLFAGDTLSEFRIGFVLGIVHILVIGLYLHQLLVYIGYGRGFTLYLTICGLILIYHVLKIVMVYYWNYLVSSKEKTLTWLKSYHVFNIVLGLVLFPVVIIITYTKGKAVDLSLNIGILIFVLYLIILFIRSVKIFFSNLSSFIYLILYFCSLEILPLMLAVKVVLKSG